MGDSEQALFPFVGQDMVDPLQWFRKMAQERGRTLANYAFVTIPQLLRGLELGEPLPALLNLHQGRKAELLAYFPGRSVFCHLIGAFAEKLKDRLATWESVFDPVVTADAALFVNTLTLDYPNAFPPEDRPFVADSLRKFVEELVGRTAKAASDQVDRLCRAVVDLSSFLEQLRLGDQSRVVLIELPVGNSLPTILLRSRLTGRGVNCHVLRLSLSRNDAAEKGATRKEILLKGLHEIAVGKLDLVVYLDEWLTGSNFANVSRYLDRVVRGFGSYLLPVGLLSHEAGNNPRYATQFVPGHDRLCSRLGVDGARFRSVFRPLRSQYPSDSYFFWSEQDWLAGYRKLQFLGSLFSVLDRTVERLRGQPKELERAKIALIEDFVTSGRPESEVGPLLKGFLGKNDDFAEKFEHSYQDYLLCRPETEGRLRASTFCWGGETMAEANQEALGIINEVVGKRRAAICLMAAVLYVKYELFENLESFDRFHFKGHAPVLTELEGPRRSLHEAWIKVLVRRLACIS